MRTVISSVVMLFLCVQLSSAQNDRKTILKDPEFIELKKEAINYFTSQEYLDRRRIFDEFGAKMPTDFSFEIDFNSWIKERINDTQFNSIEEAVEAKENLDRVYAISEKKESAIYKKRIALTKKYGRNVLDEIYEKEIGAVIIKTLIEKSEEK